ncbi:hypothetical protein TNCV_1102661, partial [Trichonephila clavipes]
MALEVQKLLRKESSNQVTHHGAQAFVIRGENYKPRMVIDYSRMTIKNTLCWMPTLCPKIER